MPLRVKCRCGQELVLRFNEWVYALFGLLVLCLLVNGTALVLVVSRLGALRAHSPPSVAQADRGEREEPAASRQPPAASHDEAARPAAGPPPEEAGASPVPIAAPPVPTDVKEAALKLTGAKPSGGGATGASPAPEPARPAEAPAARPGRPRGEATRRLLLPDSTLPLERFLVLLRGEEAHLRAAFLHDDDAVIRRAALGRLLESGTAAPADLVTLVLPAAPHLLPERRGRELLQRLCGEDLGADAGAWEEWGRRKGLGAVLPGAPEVATLAARAEALRLSAPGLEEIRALGGGKERHGTDVLLALDVTESMKEPLEALRAEAWLFPAMAWALPGLRAGLLLYADEVLGATPLSADPGDPARGLAAAQAEGGGDVPEGVHEALRAALQLGRFDWRPAAQKHIVFVGDAPPPRQEVQGLLSLARECHRDGGYRIHAISVRPEEGRKATLHFPELASEGGGRAVTAADQRIAHEVFLSLFPAAARGDIEKAIPALASALAAAPAPGPSPSR